MPEKKENDSVEVRPKRSYYYDDATGYEDFDPRADDDEDDEPATEVTEESNADGV